MDVNALVTSAAHIIGLSKKISEAAKKLNDAEITMMTAELIEHAANIKLEKIELVDRIDGLEKALTEARKTQDLQLTYNGYYYVDRSGNAYCPVCYQDSGKTFHLRPSSSSKDSHFCYVCKNRFGSKMSGAAPIAIQAPEPKIWDDY